MPLLPLFPLEIVVFPGAPLPLHIFEPRYKEMIGECLSQNRAFGMVRAKENALSAIGCSARILTVIKKYEDGRMDISAEGAQRFEIIQLSQERSFLQAEVAFFDDEPSTVSKMGRWVCSGHQDLVQGKTPCSRMAYFWLHQYSIR